jgi:sugar phosphate isomerase/epimerase
MANPPLSAPVKSGLAVLERLGLTAEASMADELDDIEEYSQVLISAHAPQTVGELRLNVAATDDDFRRESIDHIVGYVDRASLYPNVRQVNIHFAPRRWVEDTQPRGQQGDYSRLIDGVREIAAYAEERDIEIVMENATTKWTGVDDDVPAVQVDWSDRNVYFGMAPEEWIQICEDVDRQNVALCLDSSHVCTYAQTFADDSRREEVALAYLARPELIRHVHWSDNYLYDPRGREDSHLSVGKGTLPTEMHRAIKRLDATLLLEHFYTAEELEEELAYIDSL